MKNRRMSMRILSTSLVLILCMAILATACQKKTPTSITTGGTTTSTSGTNPSTSATGSSTTSTQPTSGSGTLNLADEAPVTLDPAAAADAGSASYIEQIFSGLVRLDDTMSPTGDIAANWDKSADGKTYTFHLRQGVKFHDGATVKASDFKYSWERALNPATQSLTAGTYLNDIVGAGDILSGKATQLSGVRAIDDSTLEVKIDAPKAYFLDKMAYPTSFVVEKSNVQSGNQWWQKPVGTGPFKLKQWTPDQSLVLQRNDNYYGEKAKLQEVNFRFLSGNPINLYQTNQIDVTGIGGAYMGIATDPSNPVSKELKTFSEMSFYYLGFNTSVAPFDDVNVRLAFTYAVDKARMINLAMQDQVTAAAGILPPGMPGYNNAVQGLGFDPNKAKQYLAKSKYGSADKLPPIVLTTSGYGNFISGALGGVINDWRTNLGVEVSVRQLEPQAFLYSLGTEKNNIFDMGWIADYPDPQDFLDILFRTGSQNNYGGYSNSQLDALLDKAAIEQDPATRSKEYQQAEQMVIQDAAVLPLFFSKSYVLVKPWVTGYVLSPLGFPLLNRVSIGPKPPTGLTAQ